MPLARSFSEAKAQVEQLVERFDRNLDFYIRAEHKETQACAEFIDPLFEALVCFAQFIEQLPIRTIHFEDPTGVARHEKMVALVERMLDLHKKLAAGSILADQTLYQRQIEAADRQIDALVYELHGLTEEEIAIVEGR